MNDITRRTFIGAVAAVGATTVTRAAQTPANRPGPLKTEPAPDGRVLKAGVIGCGRRPAVARP